MAEDKVFVQFGCGWSAPQGWKNYDASLTLKFERIPFIGNLYIKNARRFPKNVDYGNIVRGLPHGENSVDGIYASHVLEHLSLDECRVALEQVYRMLRPGGTFRLIVPDLEWRARIYLQNAGAGMFDASGEFMRSCCLGLERRSRSPLGILSALFGGSAHLWMWDERSMRQALSSVGFTNIRKCAMGDADEPAFLAVEDKERFFDNGQPELAMQAQKPR